MTPKREHLRATAPNPSPHRGRRRLRLVALLALLASACDATPPGASAATPSPPAAASTTCPATDLAGFVAAFADNPALQKAHTAPVVDTAFVDWSAQPEPTESVEAMSRDSLRFPVMPDRARQQAQGLQYREIGRDGDRTTIALEIPDTDAQVLYTFRRDACWTLVKIVDPAFGKAFAGDTPTSAEPPPQAPSAPNEGDRTMPAGLSAAFADCMTRAGSQNIAQAECLTAERDRQNARLNTVYNELIGHLQGERRERMVEAQRAWVQLQDKDGAFETSVLDELGAMGNLQSTENQARAVAQRADLLEKYLALTRL